MGEVAFNSSTKKSWQGYLNYQVLTSCGRYQWTLLPNWIVFWLKISTSSEHANAHTQANKLNFITFGVVLMMPCTHLTQFKCIYFPILNSVNTWCQVSCLRQTTEQKLGICCLCFSRCDLRTSCLTLGSLNSPPKMLALWFCSQKRLTWVLSRSVGHQRWSVGLTSKAVAAQFQPPVNQQSASEKAILWYGCESAISNCTPTMSARGPRSRQMTWPWGRW